MAFNAFPILVSLMEHHVKSYYDQNTNLFLKLSGNSQTASIHQPLWFEGTTTRSQALNNTNQLIVKQLQTMNEENPQFLDLGCGVGGTMFFILQNLPSSRGFGITISPKQVEIGTRLIREQAFKNRCKILEGSFLNIPDDVPSVHLAYAIESFVHSTDSRRFLIQTFKKLKPGGQLMIIDDFLSSESFDHDHANNRIIDEFRKGWMLSSLISIDSLLTMAAEAGFKTQSTEDLTRYLPADTMRVRLIGILRNFRWLFGYSSYFKSQLGGIARQEALKRNLIEYRKIILMKDRAG